MSSRLTIIVPVPDKRCSVTIRKSLAHSVGLGEVELLTTIGGCPARQRNLAVAEASSELIYFIDDDTWVSPETLKAMVQTLERLEAAALGGPAVTRHNAGLFETAVGDIMASPFGSGVVRARSTPVGSFRAVSGEELVSCHLLIRKSWFEKVGGFDESLYPGEDVDLLKKLRAHEAPMFYDPQAIAERSRRQNVWQLACQYYAYGQGRGLRLLKHLKAPDLIFVLPTALLFYLVLLPLLPPHAAWAYFALAALEGLRLGFKRGCPKSAALCGLLLPVQHLSYGWGMLLGLLGVEAKNRGEWKGIERCVLEL